MRSVYLAAAVYAVLTTVSEAQDFDIVILNGRVMDPETGYDAVANVGVSDGSIKVITQDEITGEESIDATGYVVAPGFIDMHSHVTDSPFMQKLMLRNGVTTPLELEMGAWPVDNYYDALEGKSQTNYGASVSLFGIRESTLNPEYDTVTGSIVTDNWEYGDSADIKMAFQKVPTDDEAEKFVELSEEGIRRGALGFAVPVGYAVDGITAREIIGIQKLAGKYGVATFVHARFSSQADPLSGALATSEFISNLGIYGGGLLFHHIHQQALGTTDMVLNRIDDARANGLNVLGEIYPYNFGATIVAADYLVPSNYGPAMGRTYSDITESATGKPLTKERYEELMQAAPTTAVTFLGSTDEVMLSALARPGTTVVGSDAFPLTILATGENAFDWDTPYEGLGGHPRGAGSYALVLRLVREDDLMSLMTALGKMSYDVARFLEDSGVSLMAYKGRIQVGADADITIFDPETVTENSTMDEPGLPSTGIPYVLVNGTIVVKDSKVLEGVYPGQAVRMPVRN